MASYEDLVSQAHRLLRMKWNNPLDLAQELYSMLMPGIGTDIPAEAGDAQDQPPAFTEVQRRLAEAQQFFSNISQSATVNNTKTTVNQSFPTTGIRGALVESMVGLPAPSRFEEPPVRIDVNPQPLPPMPFLSIPPLATAPFVSAPPVAPSPFVGAPPVLPGPLAYSRPDLPTPDLGDLDWTVPVHPVKPFQIDEGGGGILGKIVSGSGKTYIVDLYENGMNSGATQKAVRVVIPQIASGDDIPDGTWIAPVIQVTSDTGQQESYYQPPIWLS